jgi:myo-inositol-1(or 4)-monophosphatase
MRTDELLAAAKDAALIGGAILVSGFRKLQKHQVRLKGEGDYVTELDHKSEEAVIRRIRHAFPDHAIHAEESGSVSGRGTVEWLIDPLDGTTNYVHGVPFFCVSVAAVIGREPVAGVVYDPSHKEMFWAAKGRGAFLNGARIQVSQKMRLEETYLASGFPWRSKPYLEAYLNSFRDLFSISSGVRRMGSAAIDLAYTASGRFDGFWEMKLKPWDIAAGALLIREAGGRVSDFRGGRAFLRSGNVLAANPHVFPKMLKIVKMHLAEVE